VIGKHPDKFFGMLFLLGSEERVIKNIGFLKKVDGF
jgi:hypothetical protein